MRNCFYMMTTPGGLFIRYDFATQSFTAIGRSGMNWVRHMPMDRHGNVYVLGEGKVRHFDPVTEKWRVAAENDEPFGPISAFCWTADRRRLYLLNYVEGRVFTWQTGDRKITELGWLHPNQTPLYIYNIHLNADETKLFAIGASNKRAEKGFYMFDVVARKAHKLFAIDDIMEHELEGKVRSKFAYVDFNDFGGVTGEDGTMYMGFHGGGRDQDLDPGGVSFVALVGIRVREGDGPLRPHRVAPVAPKVPAKQATPWKQTVHRPGDVGKRITGVGVVRRYKMAVLPADRPKLYRPLAYWVELVAAEDVPGSRPMRLYCHVAEPDPDPKLRYIDKQSLVNPLPAAKTKHDPRFERYLLAGRTLRYTGRAVAAAGDVGAHVNTAVDGGSVAIEFNATPATKMADLVVGKTVVFEATILPRKLWMSRFKHDRGGQTWHLVGTLPSGETVEIGNRLFAEVRDFYRCLSLIRDRRAVKVRVIGQVWDAAEYRRPPDHPADGTPRDVQGKILIAVEQLEILGDEPAEKVLP